MKKIKKTCPSCGGAGQISYFQGVSRFLLTTEECPECCGIGYLQEKEAGNPEQNRHTVAAANKRRKPGTGKKDPD